MRTHVPKIIYASVYLLLILWVINVNFETRSSQFVIASLLGLGAYSLMWAHYFNGFIRDIFFPDSDTKTLYNLTRYVVFGAFILHPLVGSYVITSNDYGLPPASYVRYFGWENFIYIVFGTVGLLFFILFDFKTRLGQKAQTVIGHLSNLAMVLITIHALMLGYVLKDETNRLIFYTLGVTLLLMLGRLYLKEKNKILSIVGISVVAIALVAVSFIVLKKDKVSQKSTSSQSASSQTANPAETTNDNQSPTSQVKKITLEELKTKDGKSGNACWVAIDGDVYDLSDSSKWRNGEHTTTSGVECGNDLSEKIKESPHGKSTLSAFPVVGSLQ